MVVKALKYLLVLLLLINITTVFAKEKIVIEKYEHWNHPVLKVFKRYNINLYKVSYPKDGLCPAFYAKFKYSPDPRGPASNMFKNTYAEILKANSNFPYSIVDKEDDMRINVGWADKAKTTVVVDMDKASSVPTCKNGTAIKFIVDEQMKELIMKSPYKASLHGKGGKEMVAYLFAEDEETKPHEYYLCSTGEKVKSDVHIGHYYIYLYDVKSQSFYPTRTNVFKNFNQMRMGLGGADFFVLPRENKNHSDVLIISQFGDCDGNINEAYGLVKDEQALRQFTFNGQSKDQQLYGQIDKSYNGSTILTTHIKHKTYQFRLNASDELGEINSDEINAEELFQVSQEMKQNILRSTLKANLRASDGKKLIAYLYSDNETHAVEKTVSCIDAEYHYPDVKRGKYYLYLYDPKLDSFLPDRIKVFKESIELEFNTEGADLVVLSGKKENRSDILLISQFGGCTGNQFEAFGLSAQMKLKQFKFALLKKRFKFYGRITNDSNKSKVIADGTYDDDLFNRQMLTFSVSKTSDEVAAHLSSRDS